MIALSLSSPSQVSHKKPKHSHNNSELLIDVVHTSNEFLSLAVKCSQPDEDYLFGQSVGKDLKTLSPNKKHLATMKIQLLLHKIRWAAEEICICNIWKYVMMSWIYATMQLYTKYLLHVIYHNSYDVEL